MDGTLIARSTDVGFEMSIPGSFVGFVRAVSAGL